VFEEVRARAAGDLAYDGLLPLKYSCGGQWVHDSLVCPRVAGGGIVS
jgi:hypothetical protein